MKIYRDRAHVYLGLVVVLLAAAVIPLKFLHAVVADSIASFFPIALTVCAVSLVFRRATPTADGGKFLGMRTNWFCVGLAAIGLALMASYPFAESVWPSRFGMTLCLADIEIFLYHREALKRRALAKPK